MVIQTVQTELAKSSSFLLQEEIRWTEGGHHDLVQCQTIPHYITLHLEVLKVQPQDIHLYVGTCTCTLTDVIVASSVGVNPHSHCTAGDNTDSNISSMASASCDRQQYTFVQMIGFMVYIMYYA